jgi:PPOX class probable F420-dependent enzyme
MTTIKLSDKAREFLGERRFAVLATINRDGTPQLTVMWYELQGDEIMMNTADGRVKAHNLRRDPRISICIEDGTRYITLSGTAQLNDDQATAQADIKRLALRYRKPDATGELNLDQFARQQRITIRMPIERVVEDV